MGTALQSICSCKGQLTLNGAENLDPTRTTSLRASFSADMTRRFKTIKKLIWESVVTNDALGLTDKPATIFDGRPLQANAAIPKGAFAFSTDANKVQGFMQWLQLEVNQEVFGIPGPTRAIVGNAAWSNVYIDSAYKRGLKRADLELKKILPDEELLTRGPRSITSAFNTPFNADKVGLIYTRTYSELKGITDDMENIISRQLAQGIAEGRGPRYIARHLNNAIEQSGGSLAIVDKRGVTKMRAIVRARILARTEVIRAHHVAMINTYREAGIEGVKVTAEWRTAGDERVCPDCAALEGEVFTLDEIEGMIPLHPQCRCVALPYLGKVSDRSAEADKVEEAFEQQTLPAIKPPKKRKV